MKFKDFLLKAVGSNASDIHLSQGMKPAIRINRDLKFVKMPELTEADMEAILKILLDDQRRKQLQEELSIDFSYEDDKRNRYRINIFHSLMGIGIAIRVISAHIKTLSELQVPAILETFTTMENGLVLITGPTNSGKSTTLAAMIEQINVNSNRRIITIEDPIEYRFESKKSLITQRELGITTHSFHSALRSALREDPDVIMVGELRDLDTIRLALTAAETGHLVLATLHTNSAVSTINRIIDAFPSNEKAIVTGLLSMVLRAVVSQKLLPTKEGNGMVAAFEILIATQAVQNLIRENKVYQIPSSMQVGSKNGMVQMKDSLRALVNAGKIDAKTLESMGIKLDDLKFADSTEKEGSSSATGMTKGQIYSEDEF